MAEEFSSFKTPWKETGTIYRALVEHQGYREGEHLRLLKLNEEVGEVMQAYIGLVGANKRKGINKTVHDVASELCDVIITAMVALDDYVADPGQFFLDHLNKVTERVKEQGS